ncbi:uncharacterized protein LOC135398993 isoform X2 [Ornithodoros turicata]|uniref:uncharacterized protein LOC135398993 isoform X2 n=1 Tax=Ornithodoros turicata TaxID=34597 RepID=UPI003139A7E4
MDWTLAALVTVLIVCLQLNGLLAAMDLQVRQVCSKYEIRLRCDPGQYVVVHDAHYTTAPLPGLPANSSWPTCTDTIKGREDEDEEDHDPHPINCTEDIRQPLNNRCSGTVHCLFTFSRDHLDKKCPSDGVIVVQYACVTEKIVNNYCSFKLRQREGYISSPAFPHYYPGLSNCSWHIQGAPGQTVSVTMLDVSMKQPKRQWIYHVCEDSVTVADGQNKLLVACGDSAGNLRTVNSASNHLTVQLKSSEFVPYRGFILKYKLVGCPTPRSPKQGYLVFRNESTALFKCCKDHFFTDTFQNTRTLFCIDGNEWNDTVSGCASRYELALNGTLIVDPQFSEAPELMSSDQAVRDKETEDMSHIADILIPALLMGGLILGNIVIVLIIFRLRKRQQRRANQNGPVQMDELSHDEAKAPLASILPSEV